MTASPDPDVFAGQVAGWITDLEADLARVRAEAAALVETLAWARRLQARAPDLAEAARPRVRGRVQVADVRDYLRRAGAATVRQVAGHFAISPPTARARLDALVAAGTATWARTDTPGGARVYRFVPPGTPPEAPRNHTAGPGPRVVALDPIPGTGPGRARSRRVRRAKARRGRR